MHVHIHRALLVSLQSLVGIQSCLAGHCAVKYHHLFILSSLSIPLFCISHAKPLPSLSSPSLITVPLPRPVHPIFGSSLISVHFVKAEWHRSTGEEEVEGGAWFVVYANTSCFRGVWIGWRWGGRRVNGGT